MTKNKKNLIGALSGNFLEYYDVTLYGFFAPILGPIFFPSKDPSVSTLMVLGAFAIGFLARPFGGALFGYLGDRLGRKTALSMTVLLVTIPTFVIGLMPSYDQIGILAPFLVIFCRLLQGICTGGEYPGAAVFISEHAKDNQRALLCSIVPASSTLGAVFGTLLGALFTREFMPDWGWRIPFLLGGLFGLIGFVLRKSVSETQDFKKLYDKEALSQNPLLETLKTNKRSILGAALIGTGTLVPFYMITIYMMGFMTHKNIEITQSQRLFVTSCLMLSIVFTLPLFGALADKYGQKKLMILSCILTAVLSYPLFNMAYNADSLMTLFWAQVTLTVILAAFVAPTVSFFTSLFPARTRYSAMGFSVSLGEGIGGGITPFLAALLVQITGNPLAPASYLIVISLISIIGIYITQPNAGFKESNVLKPIQS